MSSLKDAGSTKRKKYKHRANTTGSIHPVSGANIGSSLTKKPMSTWDISKVIGNHDYFSDINPRNMRRLMNIVYITGHILLFFIFNF